MNVFPHPQVHYYLAPSVSNYLRIIFLDPVHPNSMFKVGGGWGQGGSRAAGVAVWRVRGV